MKIKSRKVLAAVIIMPEKRGGVDFNSNLSPVCNPELPSLYVLRSKGNKRLKEGDV